MIQTKSISKGGTANFLKKAMHVASCYGFENIEKVIEQQKKHNNYVKEAFEGKTGTEMLVKKQTVKQNTKSCNTDVIGDEVVNALKTVVDNGLLPCKHPILIYQNNIEVNFNKKDEYLCFGLVIIGMKKSIAEAIAITTASAILDDMDVGDTKVHINSMGDKDSVAKFSRELNSYLRKNINIISANARQSMKKDIFDAFSQLQLTETLLEGDIPQSIKYLTDKNRKHLSEILEYLETGNISYAIDNYLVGSRECHSQTLFEIRNAHDSQESEQNEISILARGGRCDEISRRLFNIDVPTVGVVFEFANKDIKKKEIDALKKSKKPKTYFIQLGYEAKKRSLLIIDMLRRANVTTFHSLDNDKFSDQLDFAKYLKVPYTIIMGQREVLDGTVIVRNMDTQYQNTVLVDELLSYLKENNI